MRSIYDDAFDDGDCDKDTFNVDDGCDDDDDRGGGDDDGDGDDGVGDTKDKLLW